MGIQIPSEHSRVTVTLSGMSDYDQLAENISYFEKNEPLTEAETETLRDIAKKMTSKNPLPCTGCRYCTSHCPQGLNNTACKLRDLRFRIHIHEVQPRVSGKASGTACKRTAQSVSGVNPITLTPAKPFDNSFWVCFRER